MILEHILNSSTNQARTLTEKMKDEKITTLI